jgi:hopanoid biosynthesis associated protein HpnK
LALRQLIVTGDDFGLDESVNEAIERAHRNGILNTASLMVGAPAAGDAVARARALPSLRVGLHVVVARGRPVLPADAIPDLLDAGGSLRSDLVGAGILFFFRPSVRRQLRAEISAQFEAYRQTALPLDHVNVHNHMHLHPTVLDMLLEIGRDYGVRAVRLPYEPVLPSWRAARGDLLRRWVTNLFLAPWITLVRRRIKRLGFVHNDYVFGLHDSGQMCGERVLQILERLPPGISELFFHPTVASGPVRPGPGHENDLDLAALLEPRVAEAISAFGIRMIAFSDLAVAAVQATGERPETP